MSFIVNPFTGRLDANGIPLSSLDTQYLKLDQTTPQTVTGGSPLFSGGITLNATTITTDSTTGLKVGDSSQKIAFLGATPIVRQANTIDLGTVLSNFGLRVAGTAYPITTSGAVAFSGTIGLSGQVTVGNAINFAINTSTGTKFGTGTTQKIGFYNATPIVQPVATLDLGTVLSNLGFRAAGTAWPLTSSGTMALSGTVGLGVTTITNTSTAALKVTGTNGDAFTVDTTNMKVIIGGATHKIGFTGDEGMLVFTADVITCNDDFKIASDTLGLWLGAGADLKITYDGTVGKIDTSLVAASDLQIACGTDKTVVLTESVWDDILPYSINPGTGLTAMTSADYGTTGFKWYQFSNNVAANEEIQCFFQLPHSYKIGTDVSLHLHVVAPVNGSSGVEDVEFSVSYQWVTIGDSYSTTTNSTIASTVFRVGADDANKHLLWDFTHLTGTNKGISSDLMVRIKRLTKSADRVNDDYTNLVWLRYVDVHFEKDTIGSRQETAK